MTDGLLGIESQHLGGLSGIRKVVLAPFSTTDIFASALEHEGLHKARSKSRHSGRLRDNEERSTGVQMATLQQQIAEKFLAKLTKSKKVDGDKIDRLRTLLADSKKLKADEFVKVFSLPAGGDLK
jgi:hypothetical protein